MFDVRVASKQHVIAHEHVGWNDWRLRNIGNVACSPTRRSCRDFVLIDSDRAAIGHQPSCGTQHRRLAGTVGANEAKPLARIQDVIEVDNSIDAVVTDTKIAKAKRAHCDVCRVRRSRRKNGAPKNAVTTPIGVSAGLASTRLGMSAATRNAAPNKTLNGNTLR